MPTGPCTRYVVLYGDCGQVTGYADADEWETAIMFAMIEGDFECRLCLFGFPWLAPGCPEVDGFFVPYGEPRWRVEGAELETACFIERPVDCLEYVPDFPLWCTCWEGCG
jgi:hypothetical protein